MPRTKRWEQYAENCMDDFIESGNPAKFEEFMNKFFCEECRGECLSCAAHVSSGDFDHLNIRVDRFAPLSSGCIILHCLNSCLNPCNSRVVVKRSVGNMSSMDIVFNGYKNIKSIPISKIVSKFNTAQFLFMFVPIWEHLKDQEGRK